MDLIIIINLIAHVAQVFIKMIEYALIGNKIIKKMLFTIRKIIRIYLTVFM